MPIKAKDIRVSRGGISILKWDPYDPEDKNKTIETMTIRIYNAVSYKEGFRVPLREYSCSYSQIKTMIDHGTPIKMDKHMDQPLVLTVQEDEGDEEELDLKIGRLYDIKIKSHKLEVGPKQKRKLFDFKPAPSPKEERIIEIDIPPMPDPVVLPKDLLSCQIQLQNGKMYDLYLPDLKEGLNRFCYYGDFLPQGVDKISTVNINKKYRDSFIMTRELP